MHTIGVEAVFSAAHFHRGVNRECRRIHGHNYRVEVRVSSDRLRDGMVMDFRELRRRLGRAVKEWDHRLLNELGDFRKVQPTTENISRILFEKLSRTFSGLPAKLREVRVWETEGCWAAYGKRS